MSEGADEPVEPGGATGRPADAAGAIEEELAETGDEDEPEAEEEP